MALIGKLYHPAVAILPIGGKYTMGVREAAYAMQLLGSPILIPGHYDTFPGQYADLSELERWMAQDAPGARVAAIRPGESFKVS
jgi:L-ascorbate metabolism protein UlaG (beta-lactamase superfamily)